MILGKTRLAVISLASSLLFTACAGGGGGSSSGGGSALTPPTPPIIQPQALATVLVQVILPSSAQASSFARTAQGQRRPDFVSTGTNGSTLVVYQHGTTTAVYSTVTDLSSTSPNCVGSAPRVCTIPMQVPSGDFDFTLKTFDTAPVSGAIPGTAKQLAQATVTQTITLGGSNTVNFALQGITVGPPGITCTGGCGALTYMSLPADGSTHNFTFVIQATDASGTVITGSNPYATPLSVTLAESGGSGHSALILNGTNVGAAASVTKPTDTLALQYDGGGAGGYSTQTTIGGAVVRISPLYAPGSFLTHKLADASSVALTEASAPGSVAYGVTNVCATHVSSASASGSGASGTVNFSTTAAGGYSGSCTITVKDNLGSAISYPLNFAVYGPAGGGGPGVISFPGGGNGDCGTSINLSGAGQTAVLTLTDPGFSGTWLTNDTTPAAATVGVSGNTGTITAVAAGSTTITFSDGFGNSLVCPVNVTTTSGTVSFVPVTQTNGTVS